MDPKTYELLKDANAIRIAQEKGETQEEEEITEKKIKHNVTLPKFEELNEEAILFQDKDGEDIADKQRRDMVVKSHKIAKTMLECAAECIDECKKQNPDPQQKKLYDKWKVCDKIEETIKVCVEQVTDIHTYTEGDESSKKSSDVHNVAYVSEEHWGQKHHVIHLYAKCFELCSEMIALTLVHEMTHDNANTVDIEPMTPEKSRDNYPRIKEKNKKGEDIDENDVQQLMSDMMIKYPDEMMEALESKEVIKVFTDSDSVQLLEKFKNAVTNGTAESFWSELSKDEESTLVSFQDDVFCTHISMDRACLLEFYPEEVADDAECIARFAYDCYKYKEGK